MLCAECFLGFYQDLLQNFKPHIIVTSFLLPGSPKFHALDGTFLVVDDVSILVWTVGVSMRTVFHFGLEVAIV